MQMVFSFGSSKILPSYRSYACMHPKVEPTLKFTHLAVKEAFQDFGKLHPKSLGTNPELHDGLYNQCSLSLRILFWHFCRCSQYEEIWGTCQRAYKGTESLDSIADVLAKIVDEEEKEKKALQGPIDFLALQEGAPVPPLWQVMGHAKVGVDVSNSWKHWPIDM